MRPRWADDWESLATAAALMRDARAAKDDATAWAALAADWEWAVSHQRPGVPAADRPAIIAAIEAAIARDRATIALAGIAIPRPRESRARLPDLAIQRLDKLELLETLLWHERHLLGHEPVVIAVTRVNIALGRPSLHQVEAEAERRRSAVSETAAHPGQAPAPAEEPRRSPAPPPAPAPARAVQPTLF